MTTPLALSIRDLRKVYSGGLEALKGISLDVAAGDFFALLGPNGAGKSTTIGIVTGLVNKTSGRVRVFDKDLDRDPFGVKQALGLVPQEFNFSQFEPVEEILINHAGYHGIARREALRRTHHWLRQLGLFERRRAEARQLSGGMKRRMMIARAMVHEPRLLILDEPTAGVDIEVRRSMWDFLRTVNAAGTTIILTTHYLDEAESLCRNIAIIDRGEIIEHTSMKQLLAKLDAETFVFDLNHALRAAPVLSGVELTHWDAHTLEISVRKHTHLNAVFQQLSAQGIEIMSMRNKANRLEELFVQLVQRGAANAAVPPPEAERDTAGGQAN
ncbi:MAG: ABC transporter ATP-binding protein [Thiotrichales bacterium]